MSVWPPSTDPPPEPPAREDESHKGDYGRVLLIGGSQGMAGAIALSGLAALRGGAGLVTIATAESSAPVVATFHPCYMMLGLPEDDAGRIAAESHERFADHLEQSNVVAIGPGLGRSEQLDELVAELWRTLDRPLVLDADALNALAGDANDGDADDDDADDDDSSARLSSPPALRVMTPHPGEFQRLLGRRCDDRDALDQAAIDYAADVHAIVALKGHSTLVTDGHSAFRNPSGNPGMATGGAGDVLTGLIAAMLGQFRDVDPLTVVRQAVYQHGQAGDRAAEARSQRALTALDIVDSL